jgi:rare lipoprotein A
MRAKRTVRVPTAAQLVVGASALAFPATALAVNGDSHAPAAASPTAALHSDRPLTVNYDHVTVVRGSAPSREAGTRIELEYRPADARRSHSVAVGRVHRDGHFALAAQLDRSGRLQVVPAPLGAGRPTRSQPTADQVGSGTGTTSTVVAGTALRASAIRPVTVRPKLKLAGRADRADRAESGLVGRPLRVSGRLLPGLAHRRLVLEVRRGRRWVPVAHGRTHRGGRFTLHYTPTSPGSQTVHVTFAGDRLNSHANSNAVSIVGMHYAEVSWYYDAGNTACGFHATYGIASRTLACGSKVTLSNGGRSVVATVDDRGPFVYSRLYDLNQNTAAALDMRGVATILASV